MDRQLVASYFTVKATYMFCSVFSCLDNNGFEFVSIIQNGYFVQVMNPNMVIRAVSRRFQVQISIVGNKLEKKIKSMIIVIINPNWSKSN